MVGVDDERVREWDAIIREWVARVINKDIRSVEGNAG